MKELLKGEILKAFANVKLGEGIGLFEAQGIDDYETSEKCEEYRSKDEKIDWKKLSEKHLNACYSSLSFFDPEGMRFHLPAYLLLTIDGKDDSADIMFHLTHLNDYSKKQFDKLDLNQRMAVRKFLEWSQNEEIFEFYKPHIIRVLDEFWIYEHTNG